MKKVGVFGFVLLCVWIQGLAKTRFVKTDLCGRTVVLEVVRTPQEKARGLKGRANLESNAGMIFVYDRDAPVSFWMDGVLIPLSIGFFDHLGRLLGSEEMKVEKPGVPRWMFRRYRSPGKIRYVVEMPSGWFEKKKRCLLDLSFLGR